jgi:hypothetical protein
MKDQKTKVTVLNRQEKINTRAGKDVKYKEWLEVGNQLIQKLD